VDFLPVVFQRGLGKGEAVKEPEIVTGKNRNWAFKIGRKSDEK